MRDSGLRFSDMSEGEAVGFACCDVFCQRSGAADAGASAKVPLDVAEAFVLKVDVSDNIAINVLALAREKVGGVDGTTDGVIPGARFRVRDDLAILVVKLTGVVPVRVESLVSPSVIGVKRPNAEVASGGGKFCGQKRLCKKQE